MFEPTVVVIGNVLTNPEWRRTTNSKALVANFRVASSSRRMDRESGQWVDGDQFRIRVSCWRRLAEGVASSVQIGDPVVVAGRLFTRDWLDADGHRRTSYELEATSVGHDLTRGRAKFYRAKAVAAAVGRADDPAGDAPLAYGDGVPDEGVPTFEEQSEQASGVAVPGGGFEPFDTRLTLDDLDGAPDFARDTDPSDDDPDDDGSTGTPGPEPVTVPDGGTDPGEPGDREPHAAPATNPRRARTRTPRRQPVAV